MRVVFDVLGAPTSSGGMRLYSELLVRAWLERWPDDEVTVVGDRWAAEVHPRVRHVHFPSDRFATRSFGQIVLTGLVHRWRRADVTISVSTMVSPLSPRGRRMAVVHDWRHLQRPEEFGAAQRLYRRLWSVSARRAAALVSISPKTLRESRAAVPTARHELITSGHDHAASWALGATEAVEPASVITFGHHTNKRPDLAVAAFALSAAAQTHRLVVLGAAGELADRLRRQADSLGVGAAVDLPGFVDEATYRQLVAGASAVLLVSSDEGFGLPGSEAAYFGIPFVTAADNGLHEIHAAALAAAPEPKRIAARLDEALAGGRSSSGGTAGTWSDTARGFRDLAVRLVAARTPLVHREAVR